MLGVKVGMQGFFVQRRLKRPVQPLTEQIGYAEHHFVDLPGRDHHIAQKAVRHLLQQPPGGFGMVAGIHVIFLHQPGHCIPGNGGGVHHHGHAHGNDPHAQRFLRQAQPVIAHAAAGFNAGALKAFEAELMQTVIPFVEDNYRVRKEADSRALAGLSMGGIQTLYAGLYHTDLFAHLGVFSSGWLPFYQKVADDQYEFINKNKAAIDSQLRLLWIAMGGKEDIAYQNCQNMLKEFDTIKLKYTYSEYPGGHTWPVWRNNLYNFAQLLFNK